MSRCAPNMDETAVQAASVLVQRAMEEDVSTEGDITSAALIPQHAQGSARFVARMPGRICGLGVCQIAIGKYAPELQFAPLIQDGDRVEKGGTIATVLGSARSILLLERTCLNFLGRLSGIATLTAKYVHAVEGTRCVVLDTRKTTPGWRSLEKYAVRCGGGQNHRRGLYDGILIKDNHLALCAGLEPGERLHVDQAIDKVRHWLQHHVAAGTIPPPIEVEVDSIELLQRALPVRPDIVLLDNMNLATLKQCVALRNESAPTVLLEASGGVQLDSVGEIARTGVDRVSVGALTHSAPNMDIALDWETLTLSTDE